MDSIPLSGKKYTFLKESFRYNTYKLNNNWYPSKEDPVSFWSYIHHFKREHALSEKDQEKNKT